MTADSSRYRRHPSQKQRKNLPECLSSLGRFSEVLVVDSGSTDRTLEICAAWCESVAVLLEWRIPKKAWTLRNHKFQNVGSLSRCRRIWAEFVSK